MCGVWFVFIILQGLAASNINKERRTQVGRFADQQNLNVSILDAFGSISSRAARIRLHRAIISLIALIQFAGTIGDSVGFRTGNHSVLVLNSERDHIFSRLISTDVIAAQLEFQTHFKFPSSGVQQ